MSLAPHGGSLRPRLVDAAQAAALKQAHAAAPRHAVTDVTLADLEMFAVGALSPLEGFLGKADWDSVVQHMQLADGTVWSIPITLGVDADTAKAAEAAGALILTHGGRDLALVEVSDVFTPDVAAEARGVFRTEDDAHPGVAYQKSLPPLRVAGKVHVFEIPEQPFGAYRLTPAETRAEFAARGWKTIVAFQTRNPIHRAHEYLTKVALEVVDGLLIHPLVGQTKGDDVPADVRMKCYEVMMEKFYNPKRVMLGVFPAAMRYAGPREAVFHALVRKNYGCTHFIVGRDHAGVGNYYGTYDAQTLIDEIPAEQLGITPLKFENSFWCKRTGQMATEKTSPSTPEERIFLSGTKVRDMLTAGQLPPEEFSRPEIAQILVEAYRAKA
jgi:sulfate adenylyltransferase